MKILRYIFCIPLSFVIALLCGMLVQFIALMIQDFFCALMIFKFYGMCEDSMFFAYAITTMLTINLTYFIAPDKRALFIKIASVWLIVWNVLCLFYDFWAALIVLIGLLVYFIAFCKYKIEY